MVTKMVMNPRRLSVSEAKAKLSNALRAAQKAPVVIHSRGRDVAALVSIESHTEQRETESGGRRFLDAVLELKRRHGGGAVLVAPPARIRAQDPFARGRRPKKRG